MSEDSDVLGDQDWFAGTSATPGWVMLATRRHGQWLDDLGPSEAASVGPLLGRISRAIKATTGSTHVYVLALGENSQHFHTVLSPRAEKLAEAVHASMRSHIIELRNPEGAASVASQLREHLAGGKQ
jgi:diadenosine tetraphosphate (Ap4A) HIT family hydrolase